MVSQDSEESTWGMRVPDPTVQSIGTAVRREFCHSAAPPSPSSRRFNRDDERVPAEQQSRRRLGNATVQRCIRARWTAIQNDARFHGSVLPALSALGFTANLSAPEWLADELCVTRASN